MFIPCVLTKRVSLALLVFELSALGKKLCLGYLEGQEYVGGIVFYKHMSSLLLCCHGNQSK